MKTIRTLFLVLLIITEFAIVACNNPGCSKTELEIANIYEGESDAYKVRIIERDGVLLSAELKPVRGYQEPTPNPFMMTGHYDDDGQLKDIYFRICKQSKYYNNSILFKKEGGRQWGFLLTEPFKNISADSIQSTFEEAVTEIHNKEYLVRTF